MGPEIYAIFTRIVLIAIVCFGLCYMLLLVGLIVLIIVRDTSTPIVLEEHPWAKIAKDNNLSFVSRSGFSSLFANGDKIVGDYRGYYLQLEYVSGRYESDTRLTVIADDARHASVLLEGEKRFNNPITTDGITNLLAPNGLPDRLRGSIKALYGGRKIFYKQHGRETDSDYLQTIFDLACDIADAYPKVVSLGGEAVPALKYIAAQDYQLGSVAMSLIQSIGHETRKRLGGQLSTLLCPSCLVRCAAHKVPRPLWQKINYYGCRSCGQSIEFLNHGGPIVARLDFKSAMTQIEQNGKLYINRFSHDGLFDFDQVQIIQATDEDVERFAVQVGNDTDPVRKPRYKQMACTIAPDCELSENTMRILRRTFGQVEVST